MPIYAYKCASCGYAKDVLQKISDDPLTVCPVCQAENFNKQLTAAGFQLKGSGWYVTDFKGGAAAQPTPATDAVKPTETSEGSTAPASTTATEASPSTPSKSDTAAAAPASPAKSSAGSTNN